MRVRFGEWNQAEQLSIAAIDRGALAMYAAAEAEPRSLDWWNQHTASLSEELEVELGTSGEVVIRPRRREAVPLAERVVGLSPPGLTVLSRRPPSPLPAALAAHALGARWAQAKVRAGFARGHLIDVVLHVPAGSGSAEENSAAEELVWALLGERRADDWIGSVQAVAAPRGGPLQVIGGTEQAQLFALAELPGAVEAAVRGLYAGFVAEPFWKRQLEAEWTLFELEPDPTQSPESGQADLVLASTCVPELLHCALTNAPFSSSRFTRTDELFFYLKYRASGISDERLAARSKLEDVLDQVLVAGHAGRVVGGGMGLRYDYVYLALSDAERGLAAVVGFGRDARLPAASWLLPFDTDLGDEWLEIWPNTGAPPA